VTTIHVKTTVEIVSTNGRTLTEITQTARAKPSDDARFFATYTRGACQEIEHALNDMLIAKYGDHRE
jgi:hypothetical protein